MQSRSVEKSEDLATSVSASRLLVVHDAIRSGQNDEAELPRWQQLSGPVLNRGKGDVEARADNTALVDSANEVHNELAASVVVNELELANVACD